MYVARTIALILCATSVLTSSVSETTGTRTAGSSGETPVDHAQHFHEAATPAKSEKNLTNDNTHKAPASESGAPSLHAEAETKNVSKTAAEATVVAEGIKLTSDDLLTPADPKAKLPKIRTASVVARKGAIPPSKISPRKGVGPESAVPTASSVEGFDEAGHSAASSPSDAPSKKIEQTSATIVEKNNNNTKTAKTKEKTLVEDVVASSAEKNSTTNGNPTIAAGSVNVSSTTETKIPEATSPTPSPSSSPSTSTTRRFKPKPTVTIGEMDIDKPIPASPTKTPPLGMPRKIDYIVPVIITIMALPLLGGAAFFLYRRGRDCWDKRHYRRMDFLIDGMYNDYSWK